MPARSDIILAFAIGLSAFLTMACASLDASADVEASSSLVGERSGLDPGWEKPWDEPSSAWDGAAPLSGDAAVRLALQNNRALRREVETIVASRADFVQAHLLPNPIINVSVGFPTDGLGGDPLAVSVIQQLAWLWRRPALVEGAEADLRERILAVSDEALRLVARVRRAHARVVFAEHARALEETNLDLLERTANLLRDRFTVGEASRLDLNRAELDRLAAGVRRTDRRADLEEAKRALLEIVGRADAGLDWTAAGDPDAPLHRIDALDEAAVIRLAAGQRLDVAAANALVAARAADADLEAADRNPDVRAGAGYRQNFSSRPGVFPEVSITPKLFDDNGARVARATSELRQAEIEADRVRQAAIAEARRAWVALRAQRDVVESYRGEILGLAESNLVLAELAFDAGETSLTVLLEAQREVNDARLELADRTFDAVRLLIELERAAGGTLEPQPVAEIEIASTGGAAARETSP